MFFIFIKASQRGRLQAREQEVKSCARWVLFSLPSAQAFFFSANKTIRIFRCVQSHWSVTNYAEWLWGREWICSKTTFSLLRMSPPDHCIYIIFNLHNRRFMSQARRTRHFARSARRGEEKIKTQVTCPLFWLFSPPTLKSID